MQSTVEVYENIAPHFLLFLLPYLIRGNDNDRINLIDMPSSQRKLLYEKFRRLVYSNRDVQGRWMLDQDILNEMNDFENANGPSTPSSMRSFKNMIGHHCQTINDCYDFPKGNFANDVSLYVNDTELQIEQGKKRKSVGFYFVKTHLMDKPSLDQNWTEIHTATSTGVQISAGNKRRKGTPVERKCYGIRYKNSTKNTTKIKYLLGKIVRKNATEIEECEDIFRTIEGYTEDNMSLYEFVGSHTSLGMACKIVLEKGEFVFYSTSCTTTASSSKSSRCKACDKIRLTIAQMVSTAEPLGLNSEIKKKTNYCHIAQHPVSAETRIRDDANQIRLQKKKIMELQYEIDMLEDHVTCKDDKKLQRAINKTFEEAAINFDKFQMDDQDGTEKDRDDREIAGADQDESHNMTMLWEVHLEHLKKVDKKEGKMKGIRFHPALLNYALMILAKTSQGVYMELQPIFKLPSLGYLKSIQKKRTGGQNERKSPHGIVPENIKFIGELFDEHNI